MGSESVKSVNGFRISEIGKSVNGLWPQQFFWCCRWVGCGFCCFSGGYGRNNFSGYGFFYFLFFIRWCWWMWICAGGGCRRCYSKGGCAVVVDDDDRVWVWVDRVG